MRGRQANRASATRPTSGLGLLIHGAETDDVRIEVPGLSLPAIKGAFQDHGADGGYVPLRRAIPFDSSPTRTSDIQQV